MVTYSDKRQRKDAYNRERGVRKLRRQVQSGRLTKENLNNRGYNKFLILKGDVNVEIDEDKVKEDQKWDGVKGYITNTRLSPKRIVENYRHHRICLPDIQNGSEDSPHPPLPQKTH